MTEPFGDPWVNPHHVQVESSTVTLPADPEWHARLLVRVVVDPDTGCWIWQKARSREGYGVWFYRSRHMGAHRAAWLIQWGGEIPAGMHLDHLCRVRECTNPTHLEVVTPAENLRRAQPFRPKYRTPKTVCKQGHAMTGANVGYRRNGMRKCMACMREGQARYRAKSAGVVGRG